MSYRDLGVQRMEHEPAESISPTYFELQPVQITLRPSPPIPQQHAVISPPPVPPSTSHQALTQQSSTPQLVIQPSTSRQALTKQQSAPQQSSTNTQAPKKGEADLQVPKINLKITLDLV